MASRKDPSVEGRKLLLVRLLDVQSQSTGGSVIPLDAVGAGVGEVVLVAHGSSARQTEVTRYRPCDAVVMAIVDSWEVEGEQRYHKHQPDGGP